jgi:Fe-S-cluster containining protein
MRLNDAAVSDAGKRFRGTSLACYIPPPSGPAGVVHRMSGRAKGGVWQISAQPMPETKCGRCPGSRCCTYVTQQIDAPRSMRDFDILLWQVSHSNVEVFKDEGHWFLLFRASACIHLQSDGRCGIYEQRPQICRDYSNEYCEYDAAAEDGFELHFTDYDALLRYCRKRFKHWDRRFERRRASAGS